MNEMPDNEMQAFAQAAAKPYMSFEHLFKWNGHSPAKTKAWIRCTHQVGNTRTMQMAEPAKEATVAASIMALEFRSGVLAIKAEVHDIEDGTIIESYDVGTMVSYAAYHGQYFWPALMGYINDSEEEVKRHQGQLAVTGEVLRLCQMWFKRHLDKYADEPPSQESLAPKIVDRLL